MIFTCFVHDLFEFQLVDEDVHHLRDREAVPEVVERIVAVVVLHRSLS
jgi:hypothetical protein